jgi:N-formylmaleamate deformylase
MREDWQTGFVATNGLRLHYTRTGATKPPIVLTHGVTDAGPCWTTVAEALTVEYDAIMVDARGHGYSDAPERGYGPAEQAEDLAGIITALELERPAVLGHSMGAATALVLAGTHPDLPGAILLEDPRRGGRVGLPLRRRQGAWPGCGSGSSG